MLHFPKIRLEIDGMKYQIVHAISQHNDELEAALDDAIDRAIASYPFESEIMSMAKDAINESIKRSIQEYFMYGEGKEFINRVVAKSVKEIVESKNE